MKQAAADHFFSNLPKTVEQFHADVTVLHRERRDRLRNSLPQLWPQPATLAAEMCRE